MKKINEYNEILNEFKYNSKYSEMKYEVHHGISRSEHIERVGKVSYYLSKFFRMDYVSATRGALLHDFFTSEDISKDEYNKYLKIHPIVSFENASKYFCINKLEEEIIKTHMFPITHTIPKSKEANLVSVVDKMVSVYEALRYQVNMRVSLFIIFLFNIW